MSVSTRHVLPQFSKLQADLCDTWGGLACPAAEGSSMQPRPVMDALVQGGEMDCGPTCVRILMKAGLWKDCADRGLFVCKFSGFQTTHIGHSYHNARHTLIEMHTDVNAARHTAT